jgi:hypothetical protein
MIERVSDKIAPPSPPSKEWSNLPLAGNLALI